MKKIMSYFISLVALGFILVSCEYLEADDVCAPHTDNAVEECSELNDNLELCDPEAEVNVPGCYIKRRDCDSNGKNCEEYCGGDPAPCDQLDQTDCSAAYNCEWWNDPNNVDRDVE